MKMFWSRTNQDGTCRHRYEPRYDERPNGARISFGLLSADELRELCITRTYVRDVCIYCGATVERQTDAR